jgi:hypothetical protein
MILKRYISNRMNSKRIQITNLLKENSNEQLNEIKKIMQNMKEEFTKTKDIMKKIKLKS